MGHDLSILYELQHEHAAWLKRNFPDQLPHEPLLGLIEEVGELSHAHLKATQGIRGDYDQHFEAKIDAVGDIFIYLMSYCNANDIDLEHAVEDTWTKVKARDWITDPQSGGSIEG